MKFNLQIEQKNKSAINPIIMGNVIASIWKKIHTFLFFAFLIGFIVFGWRLWQQSLFGAGWSDQKKQDYLNAQNKGVVFKEAAFKKAIDKVQNRKDENNSAYQPIKDIFKIYN